MAMNRIGLGLVCGVVAGACWGIVFVAPELARPFNGLQLSAGRFLAYGLIAAVLIAPRWKGLVKRLGAVEWRALVWLSLFGNIVYYVLLASAVQFGGVAMTSLVIGFLPVAVTIIGRRDSGAAPLRKLAPSLVMSAAGVALIGWQSLGGTTGGELKTQIIGLACAFGALASWTAYAVGNSRRLAQLHDVSAHDWSLLTGVVTGGLALVLVIPAFLSGVTGAGTGDWLRFIGVVGAVALLASIVGNALWNQMSRLLPLTLVGQMILFETLFALLYGFVWEQRLPTMIEWSAMALVIGSVVSCVLAHRPSRGPSDGSSPRAVVATE